MTESLLDISGRAVKETNQAPFLNEFTFLLEDNAEWE